MDKVNALTEIKSFLDGYNNDLKYLVNVETNADNNMAECIIHEPDKEPKIIKVKYTPFMYMKNLELQGVKLYDKNPEIFENKKIECGITITPLKTGNHKRLKNGYCFKVTSSKSYNAIIKFFRDGGIYPFETLRDDEGNNVKDEKGEPIYLYREMFFAPKSTEQFFISTQSRLFKGIEEYKDIHKLTFDIETTGLRYQISRVFAIGVRDNRGFEIILEAKKLDDDESEIELIQDFFNLISLKKPAIISGYNSEAFDFEFILGRAKILKMDLNKLPTTLKKDVHLKRRPNVSVKYGNTADKFTATEMWGYSVIDIIHASKKTAAVNTEIKATGLKYIAKHEKIAKPNRTYIKGEDMSIGRYFKENKMFVIDDNNNYLQIPNKFQETAKNLYKLQAIKDKLTDEQYKSYRKKYLDSDKSFVDWFRENALPKNMISFIGGKKLVKQYLLDDLWETEKVDELYNQSSFMLSKIVPTTYQRVCTMGTAAIWNLLLTAWSYENDIAIPFSEKKEDFSGGLARCYKVGYSTRIVKIDYSSLYPMLQLTWDIFPMFDITGVIKKMLLYLTTTRNIYKKLANGDKLKNEELTLLEQIDHDVYRKLISNEITSTDRAMFKIKQLPIKILNNSLFGALGSGISFNWSDNVCAARITCCGRLELRHAITWFRKYNCIALLAVTDGINFKIPDKTNIKVTNDGVFEGVNDGVIEEMWQYDGKSGISALIEKFNNEEMFKPYMGVDNDGEYISCLNLSRINYATLSLVKDKASGTMKEKIKLTGNTIKSKVMPEYIEEFIDKGFELILHGKGKEFIDYYYDYVDDIRYLRIPLKKIASKSKVKITLTAYKKRGKDKNGRDKGMQAHMELLIEKREKIAEELFQKHKENLVFSKAEEKLNIQDKMKLISNYMPPEPELDSVVYHVNTGYIKSHGNSSKIKDKETGEERFAASIIDSEDLLENPNMTGKYNIVKYLDAFNSRVSSLLVGFDEKVQKTLLSKFVKKKEIDEFGNKKTVEVLTKQSYNPDESILKNFDDDIYEESMHLEPKEVKFWNKTGYDPRLVWNGFTMYENDKVYYEIYENALKYLNDKMEIANKPKIKSINEKYDKNDFVLVKDNSEYHLGIFNGIYVEIIRENIEVPKSDIEIELDKKRAEEDEKLKNLVVTLATETLRDKHLKSIVEKREKYFPLFKKQFGLDDKYTLSMLMSEVIDGEAMLDEFVKIEEQKKEADADEFLEFEDNDNSLY
jgi:DNA polymerase elongation subunit (family B)